MADPNHVDPAGADLLHFAAEQPDSDDRPGQGEAADTNAGSWKLLIVDDEDEVHTLTRLVLKNYDFESRSLTLLSAYSGAEARSIIREHPDIAIILLDVVMEREDSGLRLVHFIRNELQNRHVRIILRTGQPGQAPEQEVVAHYDINDYKAKTELTAQKLFTTITSALRSWRDIQLIESSRRGLQKVLSASGALFEWQSRSRFIGGVLEQLVRLADGSQLSGSAAADPGNGGGSDGLSGLAARRIEGRFVIVAGTGGFETTVGDSVRDVVPDSTALMVTRATRQGAEFFFNNSFVSCIRADNGEEILFLLKGCRELRAMERDLVRIYMANAAMAFHNVNLSLEIIETQKEIIHTLGEVVETRSQETANHVLRVGKMAYLLAVRNGMDPDEAAILQLAAPMHDVGKVGIPDAILNKPGALTEAEYEVIKTHTTIGHEILRKSQRRIMRAAAVVAQQHHERWDGSGYPDGRAGLDIHLYGRITALVDVFDALANRRIYRDACDLGAVVAMLREQRGGHFDPELVDCFLSHLTEFVSIIRSHPDLSAVREEEGRA